MSNRRDPQTERKLRPLYDALDNLNNKQAIQRADKILKKEKDFHCAKVLRALALVRLLKCTEALTALEEVKSHFPLDEATLQGMSVCYKELLMPELIPDLYERALTYTPNSEDHLTQLFMGYVRIKQYKKQQQVATRLHKLTSTAAYSYWNAVSLVHMGRESPSLGPVMCFPLALKIIEKSKGPSSQVPEEVFRLYLDVLELMGKPGRALEELDNDRNVIIDERERLRLRLQYNTALGNTETCNLLYKRALVNEPDSYDFYRGYFETAFKLLDDKSSLHDPEFQIDLEKADTSLHEMTGLLLKMSSENVHLRGPALAKTDLVVRLREQNIEMCAFATPTLLVLEYVQNFGHKLCCYDDLRVIIDRLQEEEKLELTQILEEYRATVKESNGTKAMQRLATLHMLLFHLGKYKSLEKEPRLFATEEIKNFHNITLEEDLGCSYIETFALLYSWLKCDSGLKPDLLDSVKLLMAKLDKYPEGAGCRTLVTRLLEHLGAIAPAVETYGGLDTKSIQLDSLAHLLYPSLIPLGAFNRADKHARQMEAFYRTNEREVLEFVVKSYLCGKFHKVTEMFELHDSLVFSLSKSIFIHDKLWLSVLLSSATSWDQIQSVLATAREEIVGVKSTDLIDNRDYLVNEVCDSRHQEIAEWQRTTSYRHDTVYIQMRHFMLTSLLALEDAGNSKGKGRVQEILATFRSEVVEKVDTLPTTEQYPVYLMQSQSMAVWVIYLDTLEASVIQADKFLRHCVYGENVEFTVEEVTSSLSDSVSSCRTELIVNGELDTSKLPYLSALVQTLSFAVFSLCSVTCAKLQRKKRSLVEPVMAALRGAVTEVKQLRDDCSELALAYKLLSLSLDREETVDSKIASSVEFTLEEFATVILKSSSLLNGLHSRRAQPKS